MRKILSWILIGSGICSLLNAQDKKDPIVMTIAEKQIPLSEFLFLARKDGGINLADKKSLENYVELFKNFKLKVAEAESLQLDKTKTFRDELDNYEKQLKNSYLSDKEGEAAAIRKVYERGKEILSVSHIIFQLPAQTLPRDTVKAYQKAIETYNRIMAGEEIKKVGTDLESDSIHYEELEYLYVMQAPKAFEDAAFSMPVGALSKPVRTSAGYHIIKVNNRMPDPGKLRISHILISETEDGDTTDATLRKRVDEIYNKAIGGEDFAELAKNYSSDRDNAADGGLLPYFGRGEMIREFEDAAFGLAQVGDIATPIKTRYGYHIVKLIDRKPRASYEEMERGFYLAMQQNEWNFDLFDRFDEREKKKFGYEQNLEAYKELQKLAEQYFPTDTAFYNRASKMTKRLMRMNGTDFPQDEFAEYIRLYPMSVKTFSLDFLDEVYRFFVRTIATELEKREINKGFPEFDQLMKEYRDGILLFEVSTANVWNKPVEEQANAEKAWVKSLNEKYKTTINWNVLKDIQKYLK